MDNAINPSVKDYPIKKAPDCIFNIQTKPPKKVVFASEKNSILESLKNHNTDDLPVLKKTSKKGQKYSRKNTNSNPKIDEFLHRKQSYGIKKIKPQPKSSRTLKPVKESFHVGNPIWPTETTKLVRSSLNTNVKSDLNLPFGDNNIGCIELLNTYRLKDNLDSIARKVPWNQISIWRVLGI